MNPRPLSMKKKVQLMLALTILAWATQTLFAQWGFGQEIGAAQASPADDVVHVDLDAPAAVPAAAQEEAEKFVPGTARFAAGATLELRGEARVYGAEVRLKQVCRWSEEDAAVFEPLADLVLTRLDSRTAFESLTIPQIRSNLRDAGANLAVIRFAGPTTCTVSRSDVEFDEGKALQQWVDAKLGQAPAADAANPASQPAMSIDDPAPVKAAAAVDDSPVHTLKSLLVADLANRLGLPENGVEISFNPRDEKVLKLAEPVFKFHLEPKRVRNLGSVSWDVTLTTADGAADSQVVTIAANARAWQQHVVMTRPLTYKQVIRKEDLTERRTLVDRLPDDELLLPEQIVGQQAARDIKPGTVMTAKLVSAVPLVATGQFVTVTLERGGIKVKTVARAMEGGSFGQTVRVKNEATKDIYEVVLTGPQEGTLGPAAGVASLGND